MEKRYVMRQQKMTDSLLVLHSDLN